MQNATAHISLYKLTHRAQVHIGLRFSYSAAIVQKIKQIEGRRYSKTHNCWYLPYTTDSYAAFKALNIPFQIEKEGVQKPPQQEQKASAQNCINHSGTVEQGIRTLPTAIEGSKPHHSSDTSLPLQEDSDILRTQVGKIEIQFSKKAFIISVPYDNHLIRQVYRMITVTDNIKHKTILYALYASGLRLGELLSLRIEDVQWDRNQMFVAGGKGKKDRVVMLSSVLKEALHLYCNEYKPVSFLIEGTKVGVAYSPKSVQTIVKQAALKANISQKVTPHTLRHCFATHLHDGGTSIKLIQELLGHKDIKTTMIYTHVSTSTVLSINSPLDNLINKKSE